MKKGKSIAVFWHGDYLIIAINNECAYVPNTNLCDEIMQQDSHIDVCRPNARRLSASRIIYMYLLSLNAGRWEYLNKCLWVKMRILSSVMPPVN